MLPWWIVVWEMKLLFLNPENFITWFTLNAFVVLSSKLILGEH